MGIFILSPFVGCRRLGFRHHAAIAASWPSLQSSKMRTDGYIASSYKGDTPEAGDNVNHKDIVDVCAVCMCLRAKSTYQFTIYKGGPTSCKACFRISEDDWHLQKCRFKATYPREF